MEASDQELLVSVRRRDPHALAQLHDRHYDRTVRIAIAAGWCPPHVAEEVVDDAFLSLWNSPPSPDRQYQTIRPWLISVVHNKAISRYRTATTAHTAEARYVADWADDHNDTDGHLAAVDDYDGLADAVAQLPERHQLVVALCYFDQQSYAETAAVTGLSIGRVGSILHESIPRLRAAYFARSTATPKGPCDA